MPHDFVPYPFTPIRHDAVMPALHDGVDSQRRPVVVAGGGPVGLCAALGLANHGIPVVVLETDGSVCIGSRAICISRRSLEILERLGVLDEFLRVGVPWTGGRSFYRDAEVLRFNMPANENQRLPPMVNLAQYSIEQILVERATQRRELVDIRWQSRLTGIEQRRAGVRLQVTTPLGGYSIDADWLVAADGGRSFVRDALGLKLQGTRYEGRYVIVDILLDSRRPAERLAYFDPPCNPGSTVLVHKQPDNVWRIDYQLRDGEDPDAAIKPENVLPRVQSLLEMMGETGPWAPIWVGLYQANALTLPEYRSARVLLAGDAAHLLPIFGVRGANSGIDDADNLAWKLAYVIQGRARESLLDNYSTERVAAAHENLQYGTKSTEFMAPPSFAFEWMRRAVLSLAVKHPQVRSLINPRQTSAITYAASATAGGAPLAGAPAAGAPVNGAVLLECPLTLTDAGRSRPGHLTQVLLTAPVGGFTLLWLADGIAPVAASALVEVLRRRGLTLNLIPIAARSVPPPAATAGPVGWDHSGRLFALYGVEGQAAILVRPDGHILGRWPAIDAAVVTAAIDLLLGAAGSDYERT